jgi:hypothetical protein
MFVWRFVWRRAVEIMDDNVAAVLQHAVGLCGNAEVIFWVAQIETEAVDDEVKGFCQGER